jgi:hypothetical protein
MSYLFDFFNYGCTEEFIESPLQITIENSGKSRYKFVRSSERTIKFYDSDNFVQEFTSHNIVLEWIQHFLPWSVDNYQIVWHHEGSKGISTSYTGERLLQLLKLLVSDQII